MDEALQKCSFLFLDGDVPHNSDCVEADTIYLALKMPSRAVESSELLKGLAGTPGCAKLPAGLSEADVLTWRSISAEDSTSRPVEQLQRVVHVRTFSLYNAMSARHAMLFPSCSWPWYTVSSNHALASQPCTCIVHP